MTSTSFLSWRTNLRFVSCLHNASSQQSPCGTVAGPSLLHPPQRKMFKWELSIPFDHVSTKRDEILAVPPTHCWKWRWIMETEVLHGKARSLSNYPTQDIVTSSGEKSSRYPKLPVAFIYLPVAELDWETWSHSCSAFAFPKWWFPQKEDHLPQNQSSIEQGKW